MEEKSKRGGARVGAGRPQGRNQVQMSVRIDNDLAEWLKTKENRNGCINECIRFMMDSQRGESSQSSKQE